MSFTHINKITEKVSFNIASEASYVYILSGQKLIKNAQKWCILASFWKPEACGQTVLPDRSVLIGQKWVENAKIGKFKCDISANFQTMWQCLKNLSNWSVTKKFWLKKQFAIEYIFILGWQDQRSCNLTREYLI